MATQKKTRCAIYTRKSSEEGLDQGFNSLDAQYEACTAYIASQKHEGWGLVRDRFDDGGVSGGTLERPALQRLLAEIDAGRIGMVVVYKIDRLTRSLTDFAKLVDRLDAAGCSFVSVTQAFNTASSMGRLTLNVLLSFAQFEREVTAERIRDKIAASKKQGLWMGGLPPLGYDPHPDPNTRELVINLAEAETVRELFHLYDDLGSLRTTTQEADRLELRSKLRCFASGRTQGGGALSRGQIHHILVNPVYLGKIRHKDQLWPGRHEAIINAALWARVQQKLQKTAMRRRGAAAGSTPAPLTGKLRDETGDRLTPTHSVKSGRRHHYYISNRLISGGTDPTGWRLSGPRLEAAVCALIADHLERAARDHHVLGQPDLRAGDNLLTDARQLVQALRRKDAAIMCQLIVSGTIAPQRIQLTLDCEHLASQLGVASDEMASDLHQLSASVVLRRRGVEARLVLGTPEPTPDPILLRTLRDAHRWVASLRDGVPLATIARNAGHHDPYIRTRGQLAFLSPKIQAAIRDGTLPSNVTLKRILAAPVSLDWDQQEKVYGV
ncbi:Site-specific DNA recombinase [Salinihabitans flavidus]|uniref:Site-specific DNA recombinase n=1 Tax=Salinihabitans flavidus TaxID=569882 RepID=A0A1H8TDN7_9RHOB|nr:recombinase family protein [Salinihabitans flavidus]SEO88981.1 Site-specific DNA recombinase [Salinihabitans flavidus]